MKKLIALALVMSVASLATAGVVLVPSVTEVNRGDVVTFQLIADFASNGFGLQVVSDAGGTAAVGTVNPILSMMASPGVAVNDGTTLITGATGNIFGNSVAAGQVIYEFTYTVAADAVIGSTINISAVNLPGQASFVGNAITWGQEDIAGVSAPLTVVPEPATMVLLGLGALVLRRKK